MFFRYQSLRALANLHAWRGCEEGEQVLLKKNSKNYLKKMQILCLNNIFAYQSVRRSRTCTRSAVMRKVSKYYFKKIKN